MVEMGVWGGWSGGSPGGVRGLMGVQGHPGVFGGGGAGLPTQPGPLPLCGDPHMGVLPTPAPPQLGVPGPTSMLPPTRASSGGRGLSFSFRSCRLD